MDIDTLVSEMDPQIWSFITQLTMSTSECRGSSKAGDVTSETYHIKKVRRFYIICVIMFTIDDRCYCPIHALITDAIDSYGGSVTLIHTLNRLGVCSSADTLARNIQYRVALREKVGPEEELSDEDVIIFSLDNIDFFTCPNILWATKEFFSRNNHSSCSTKA